MKAQDSGRITIAANALDVSRAALECATRHARQREQFGKPIGEFQGVSFMLADMAVQLDAARLLVQRAAWLKDNGKPLSTEAAMAFFGADTEEQFPRFTDLINELKSRISKNTQVVR